MSVASVLLLTLGSLSGCANGFDVLGHPARADPHTMASYHGDEDRLYHNDEGTVSCPLTRPIDDTNNGAIDLDCFRFPEDSQNDGVHGTSQNPATATSTMISTEVVTQTMPISTRTDGKAPTSSPTTTITKTIKTTAVPTAYALASGTDMTSRNRLASILIKQSDDICTLELGRFEGKMAAANLTGDILTTGLSAASTIVGGQTAKTILSGMATFTSGAKDHFNVDLLHNQMAEAIVQAVMIERQKQLTTIVGEYGKSTAQWTIDDAIREINAYHQVCSFYRGMELVLDAVNKNKTGSSATATTAAAPSASLAEVRLEYFKNEDLLRTTADATERKALLAERAKLQGMIDTMLSPKPSEATPQVTIVSTMTTPTSTTSTSTTAPATTGASAGSATKN